MKQTVCLTYGLLLLIFLSALGEPCVGQTEENVKPGCTEGDCVNNKGTFRYEDGTVYTGQFKDGKRHGEGVFTLPNGETYTGQFAVNLYNGFGIYRFNDGTRYEGQFAGGVYHGYGVYFFLDGTKKEGLWRNGAYYRPLGDNLDKTAKDKYGKEK